MSSTSFDVTQNSLLIRAGAGAGKTTTLIRTFIQFCEEFEKKSNRLPRIAITTFTRKATQEVKERLSVKALERTDDGLFQHINRKSQVHISTIHGLLTLMVQDNADLLGLPQSVKIMDQTVQKKSLKKTVRQILKAKPEYIEILEHYSFVRLVEMTVQILEAFKQCENLAPVSTEELKKITDRNIRGYILQLAEILEFKNTAPEAWNEYFGFLENLKRNLEARDIAAVLNLLEEKPTKPRWNKKTPAFAVEGHEFIEAFWETFDLSNSDSEDFFTTHAHLNDLFLNLCLDLHGQDQERKALTGEITINDLELFSLQLVRENPQAVKDFSDRFDYYMIDEFQDTSPIQVEILDALIDGKPHFIVGDPQQSIYLFRGARSEVFYQKQKLASDGKNALSLQFLDTNYRSNPGLMSFINDYFNHMSSQFAAMKPHPNREPLKSDIHFIQTENEAQAVLQQIISLLSQNVSPKDICVLSRRNYNLMKVAGLAQKLRVPVQLQVSAGFDKKREILDLIGLLKFLVNPHDNENLILVLRSPWAHLSDFKISEIAKAAREKSLWMTLNQKMAEEKAVQRLFGYFTNYQKVGVSEAFIQLIRQSGFLDFSTAYDSSGKREANFWKFFIHLKNAERNPGFTLGRYLNENFQFLQSDLGSSQSEAIPVSQPDRVSLMTIHASKGLEFPHVIVVGFSEQPQVTNYFQLALDIKHKRFSLAPYLVEEAKTVSCRWTADHRRAFNEMEHQEHERLLYVAMTRAQTGLTLVSEKRARQLSTSWQKRSIWPETGEHDHEFYRLISLEAADEVKPLDSKLAKATSVKEKLQFTSKKVESVSVTDSLDIGIDEASLKVNYGSKINDLFKAKKGTDMHRLFESLQTFAGSDELFKKFQGLLSPEQQKSIQYLLGVQEVPLQKIIQNGFVEWGFGLKTTSGLLQGQIDLWGIVDGEAYILDYKTGSSGYAQKAYQQLAFYAHCLYQMKLIDKKMKLHFAVTYPFEELTLKQSYQSFADFHSKADPVVLKLFGE